VSDSAAVLDDDALDEARHNHPYIRAGGRSVRSDRYPGNEALSAPHAAPLSDPPAASAPTRFIAPDLPNLRAVVTARATSWGINPGWAGDLALAVHEVAANSIRHGSGHGSYRIWLEHDRVVCEVRDEGLITNPLADRTRPRNDVEGGRGLWIANQLCDLMQLRRVDLGTVVRLHLRCD
jgi:anti-sigma regulatory factor (Ser/Thr protein kinase)